MAKRPAVVKRAQKRRDIPTKPGDHFWSEWNSVVTVVQRGKSLYVIPPGANRFEVKVTKNIAGSFRLVEGKDEATVS